MSGSRVPSAWPVGGVRNALAPFYSRTIRTDVRVVAATNRNLTRMVAAREFREDLYNRLKVFPILVPPLRERVADLPLLARHFTQRHVRQCNRPLTSIAADNRARRPPRDSFFPAPSRRKSSGAARLARSLQRAPPLHRCEHRRAGQVFGDAKHALREPERARRPA